VADSHERAPSSAPSVQAPVLGTAGERQASADIEAGRVTTSASGTAFLESLDD